LFNLLAKSAAADKDAHARAVAKAITRRQTWLRLESKLFCEPRSKPDQRNNPANRT
jgi:hypothetical protein